MLDEHIPDETHIKARAALIAYLNDADEAAQKAAQDKDEVAKDKKPIKDNTVAATLVLDALTIHDSETERAKRTLTPKTVS